MSRIAELAAWSTLAVDGLLWLLTGMARPGMLALGFRLGPRGRPLRLISIPEFAAPRPGNWRASAIAYDWTIIGFQGGVSMPPLPSRPQ